MDIITSEWAEIRPDVNAEAEFLEILSDFGNPLELLREAISNSIDANATWVKISFDVRIIEGNKRVVIIVQDNGDGMTGNVLARDFWGLGFSPSRDRKKTNKNIDTIGEKGHGTKIYLRSENVIVKTQCAKGAFISECDNPLSALSRGELHRPMIASSENFWDHNGTEITVIGYNDNVRADFQQNIVKDYLLWFTKIGSIELQFGIDRLKNFEVYLKCLGEDEYENMQFGHLFPKENPDIDKLFDEFSTDAPDKYVKYYSIQDRLPNHPEVDYQVFISVEGDGIKREYNPMIRDRRRKDTGRYRVGDRYGLWICKDYIPVVRVNEWITGFGSGSNAFTILHGFVNCQELRLTANRGTIANTDPLILQELQQVIRKVIDDIDVELADKGLYTLRYWQQEQRTLEKEKAEWNRRIKSLKKRRVAYVDGKLLIEPQNESELFALFIVIQTLHPDLFEFQPLDYNTTIGIDLVARNKSKAHITEGEHAYVELKYLLRKDFNHGFQYLRWIVCWDFAKSIGQGSEFTSLEGSERRYLKIDQDDDGSTLYWLDYRRERKIEVIKLKEFLRQKLNIEFEYPPRK
jgi:hypothetical protein